MSATQYDAIVVGARCAGSPTAMLLARHGYKVLVVDRATFPSDTVSTHLIHPPGMASLRKWGLADAVVATGCPPISTYTFDFGPVVFKGSQGTVDEPFSYGPRRTILDKILVDAASSSGVEVREAFTVEEIVVEDGIVTGIRGHDRGGATVTERARVVIGADGRHSMVSRATDPPRYNEKPELEAGYYSYWSGVPMNGGFETYIRGDRGFAAWPTNDDLTLIVGGWPFAQFEENKHDIEGTFGRMLDLVPDFAERVSAGERVSRFSGAAVPNFFRKPFGPGWALVGDAGYNKDFITAQGISDAFRDADLCAGAIDQWLSGQRPFDDAMHEYQKTRDEHVLPMYDFTAQIASFEPPSPEQQQLMGAISANQRSMDGFVQMYAGVVSPADFYSEKNVGEMFAAAAGGRA
ncbi:MAG: NAD(P)/FAD-dependent oxidoreductase [Gemmatimonadales bacterium]